MHTLTELCSSSNIGMPSFAASKRMFSPKLHIPCKSKRYVPEFRITQMNTYYQSLPKDYCEMQDCRVMQGKCTTPQSE